MSLLESVSIPLGTKMPEFIVEDPSRKTFDSNNLYGNRGLLVVFTCNHCPYAMALWPRLIRLAEYASELGISTVAVNPNIHPDYPEDAPGRMKEKIIELGIWFPYLVDESQDVARRFKAQCTPDIYLFNSKHKLVYHGRMDDNWKEEHLVTRQDLKDALTNLANGRPISKDQIPSMGCSIKWRTA